MRSRSLLALVAGASFLAACQGFKEAMSAHVDVAARAASQELSTNRLAELLGNAKLPIPVSRDNVGIIANLWVDYQLMAHAAAVGDSLNDRKAIDAAVAPLTNSMRLRKYMDSLVKTFRVDSGSEATYAQGAGDWYAARHILIAFPPAATPAQKDSVRQKAVSVRAQVTAQNFTAMVAKYSNEPGAAQRGGALGVFKKQAMVPEFSNAVAALKPGEISQPIETQFGFHVIQRLPYADVRAEYGQKYSQSAMAAAESTYLARIDADAPIQVKDNAPSTAKSASEDIAAHRRDKAILASYKGGDLTVADFVSWIEGFPPQSRVTQQLAAAPDSAVRNFLRNMARNQILLERAKAANIGPTPEEQAGLYGEFQQLVQQVWQTLGIEPALLADSGKTTAARERIAATRVEAYLDRVMTGEAQPVPLPAPLEALLHDRFDWSVNNAGLDRATQRAQQLRASSDSARSAAQPKSAVPLPGPARPGQPPRDVRPSVPPTKQP